MNTQATAAIANPAEVAEHFGVATSLILRLISEGKLPHYRLGPRAIRIDLRDAEDALREGGPSAA